MLKFFSVSGGWVHESWRSQHGIGAYLTYSWLSLATFFFRAWVCGTFPLVSCPAHALRHSEGRGVQASARASCGRPTLPILPGHKLGRHPSRHRSAYKCELLARSIDRRWTSTLISNASYS